MKSFYLFTFFCLIMPIYLIGQDFAPIGAEWHYSEKMEQGGAPNTQYSHFESVKDTVLKGDTAHKIAIKSVNIMDTIHRESVFVYQDNDTLFMYSDLRDRFITYFIFNRNKGDTLHLEVPDRLLSQNLDSSYNQVIDSVLQDKFDGVQKEMYRTQALGRDTGQTYDFEGWFAETLGGFDYFFPRVVPHVPGGPGPLRCYSDKDISVNFRSFNCTYLRNAGREAHKRKIIVRVYPNPAFDFVRFQTHESIKKIVLRASTGKSRLASDNKKIDLAGLKPGHYVATIHFESGKKVHKPVIKGKR